MLPDMLVKMRWHYPAPDKVEIWQILLNISPFYA
ncbi:hypothetical protein PANA5342_0150 [Pantoea ananatis LMG 5342]|nr:hypothetical protein PANA5342_0150 [Pantoea ananatis LMG 5342]